MFLKIAFFMLLSLAFSVVIVNLTDQAQMPSIQLTKYKKIKDNCQAVKVNETFHCTLFSDLIYLLDLEDLIGTLMMVKIPIQDCADPEYFLDWIGMVCRLKFNGVFLFFIYFGYFSYSLSFWFFLYIFDIYSYSL